MSANRAPKQWQLTKSETINSYESWRQNLLYILSLDKNFAQYLADGFTWQKKTSSNPLRGLEDDGTDIPEDRRLTAIQKNAQLDLLLGQIANFCPVISRNSIVRNSTSLSDIWQKIRQHFGFASTGSHFLDLANITMQPDERPEDLFQRITAFFEDNLLTTNCGVTHHGEHITSDEDMTPSLENTIVYLWLSLIHPGLPLLVKQKYGAELRNRTLSSLKNEISQALSSLLDELRAVEDSRAMRIAAPRSSNQRRRFLSCALCKASGRNHTSHKLVDCHYLSQSDKRDIARSRRVDEPDDTPPIEDDTVAEDSVPSALLDHVSVSRVSILQSPDLAVLYDDQPVQLTLDSGATTNMVRESACHVFGFKISPASQLARQADGVTPLDVVGEVHCQLTRGDHVFQLDALVVRRLDVDVLAGNPFLAHNDIAIRPAKRQIIIRGHDIVLYGKSSHIPAHSTARRTQAYLLRNDRRTVLLPGESLHLSTPEDTHPDSLWALEPRLDSPLNLSKSPEKAWPNPQEVLSVDHTVRVRNDSGDPILIKSGEHLCQIRHLSTSEVSPVLPPSNTPSSSSSRPSPPFSSCISVDPDNLLPQDIRKQFSQLHLDFDDVFNPSVSLYNGASGNIQAVVNMGPTLPPQRKGRVPQYNRTSLVELQTKFDDLESAGVFAKPDDVNVTVEYLNTSFLVRKPNGGSRLVTSFGDVAKYSKPQPSLMPNIDNVLRDIGRWKFLIVTDLLQSFYQIPLSRSSVKYCGVATPFKGIRVYTRSAMEMPGSETCLEELMSRVLGDLIQDGSVAKVADDLYVGGDTPAEALTNWRRVLVALKKNNLRLSAKKTIVCPRSAVVLGWLWSQGTLQATPHRLTALASVAPPTTVFGLRSYVGAFKVLSRVLPGYAGLLGPLEQATAGRESRDTITWSDELRSSFYGSQAALRNSKTITIPRPADTLWIVTDGSVKMRGIAATLYVLRNDELRLAGFFNAKLRKHQVSWLPCEVEALCIGAAVRHFAPFIIQSSTPAQVLTDSRPCVQAYGKLLRGEFSASARVSTFLSVLSRYGVEVRHIAGVANLPSDFSSRHPVECLDSSCQICTFIAEMEDSVVRSATVSDVLDGHKRMPFTSRAAWQITQPECADLRRTHAHLSQGTRPSKKVNSLPDVKRYLKSAVIARDGLLVVKSTDPFQPTRERILVPRQVMDGLLTALHIRFCHPSRHQLKRLFSRYFFALDVDKAVNLVTASCHVCESVKSIPAPLQPQTCSPPPASLGTSFAADVMRRYRQLILVFRETVSSYTRSLLIDSERHDDLRKAILLLCAEFCPLYVHGCTIRVDPAPGFVALVNDPALTSRNINLEVGRVKNPNKNPVAERAIEELGLELLRLSPDGGPVSSVTLAEATASMNSRIRREGLSAHELWTQRDQVTGEPLPVHDRCVILNQHHARHDNHDASAKSKSRGRARSSPSPFSVGQLIYLVSDGNKTKAREKYMICSISDDGWCEVRKFTSSQFRSKPYTVRCSDCYPIVSTTLHASGPVRGLDDHSDPEYLDTPSTDVPPLGVARDDSGPVIPPLPPAIVVPPPMPSCSADDVDLSADVPVDVPQPCESAESPPLRRSARRRKPPTWLNDDWIID